MKSRGERTDNADEARAQHGTPILLLDEIHHLPDWAAGLKAQCDRCAVGICPLQLVATGSAALRVATGSRESLGRAGRFERMTLSQWPAAALASTFHLSEQDAAWSFVQFGSYPGAMEFRSNPARWLPM